MLVWLSLTIGPSADATPAIEGSRAYIQRLDGRTGDIFGITRPACVHAVTSGAEMRDLQEFTSDHDVLEKLDHLISVSKVVVKEDRRCQRKHRKAERHLPRTETKNQQQPATNFEGDGNYPAKRSQRQTHAADVGCGRSEGRELAEAAHEKRQTDQYAAKQWQEFVISMFDLSQRSIILYNRKVSLPTMSVNIKYRVASG